MKLISNNKKATFDYFIEEKFECGIKLLGTEVKTLKLKGCSIKESLIEIIDNEIYIVNMEIQSNSSNKFLSHDPKRNKKLLMHKKEIIKLKTKIKEKGYTIVPLRLYINDINYIKLEIGLAKGKKKVDKRQSLKEKDIQKRIKTY